MYDIDISTKNGIGTRSRTPGLLITSFCYNCFKSVIYESYFHNPPYFISVLERFLHDDFVSNNIYN